MTFASKVNPAKKETTDNQPNAFKSAMRIINALANRQPVWDDKSRNWVYTVNTPHDVVVNDLVQGLLQAAILTANNGELRNYDRNMPYLSRDKNMISDTVTLKLPANRIDMRRNNFPVHAVNHQLNTITKQLSNNWQKDADGNYRHSKTFEGFRRFGFTPELFRNLISPDGKIDVRLYRKSIDDTLCDVKDWPKTPESRSHFDSVAYGVCLTPAQLEVASKAIGFLNPARARG